MVLKGCTRPSGTVNRFDPSSGWRFLGVATSRRTAPVVRSVRIGVRCAAAAATQRDRAGRAYDLGHPPPRRGRTGSGSCAVTSALTRNSDPGHLFLRSARQLTGTSAFQVRKNAGQKNRNVLILLGFFCISAHNGSRRQAAVINEKYAAGKGRHAPFNLCGRRRARRFRDESVARGHGNRDAQRRNGDRGG